ncbi:MAG: DEAD/DEAH box helicase [Microbacterium sp.]
MDLHDEALVVLRDLTGRPEAQFHDGQFEAIRALVDEHRRTLVVQRTGWGKSAVYFVAALLQRRRGQGPALIISPLIALMRDQVAAARRAGVRAEAISSANATEWGEIEASLARDEIDVLLVSPERLVNARFRDEQLPRLMARWGLLVIDEAHCISDWGHDFRPDYRRLRDLVRGLGPDVPVLATTATANARVIADIEQQLAPDGQVLTLRGPLTRTSLRLGSLTLADDAARLSYLASHLDEFARSGIIYTLTVAAAVDLAALLNRPDRPVRAYTGRTDGDERAQLEQDLKENHVKALVATSALGMGFDKPDLGFVIHLGAPSSPVAYYQQVGRAGRATDTADVLLLPGDEDVHIWKYFATASMPTEDDARQVLAALGDAPLSTAAIEARIDVRRSQLELLLKVLAVDGAVEQVQGGWRSTGAPWVYDAERYATVREAREREQQAMLDYERLGAGQCRMVFLARQLDDETATPCGRCDVCADAWYPTSVGDESAAKALLERVGVPIEARKQWPQGLDRLSIPDAPRGNIPPAERVAEGRAIARLSDLGWGGRLRELLRTDENGVPIDTEVPAALGARVIDVLRAWDWEERPAAVVAVPSRSRPRLVRSLAVGIATAGRLRDLGDLGLAPDAAPTRGTSNSVFRVRDLWSRFEVSAVLDAEIASLGGGAILLVDDVIDTRWTMTVAGRLLLRAGSGPVLPLALASVG